MWGLWLRITGYRNAEDILVSVTTITLLGTQDMWEKRSGGGGGGLSANQITNVM